MENVYNILLRICCWKKNSIHKYEETPFDAFSFGNELTNFSLELSNVRQLEELKVVLCKPTLMNHCHWNYEN